MIVNIHDCSSTNQDGIALCCHKNGRDHSRAAQRQQTREPHSTLFECGAKRHRHA